MATTNEKILLVALVATIIIAAAIILTYTTVIQNTGSINTIGCVIWANSNETIAYGPSNGISRGTFNPGDTKAVPIWAQNTQTVNVTLSFITYNWNPATAPGYLVFGWNYTGQTIIVNQTLPLQLTLQALPNVTGFTTFSFSTNITATQAP